MYEAHFGLSDLPFRIVPDLRFYVDSVPSRTALTALRQGLAGTAPFLVVTGGSGAGKTITVRKLLAELDRSRYAVADVSSAGLDRDELLRAVTVAFGMPEADSGDLPESLRSLLERIRGGGRTALLVLDEADGLGVASLRALADLAAAGAGGAPGMFVCLVGLNAPPGLVELERLGQPLGIGATCRLRPLEAAETREYILHRLRRAGWTGRPAFDAAATDAIHAQSDGIPARINLLSNRILLALSGKASNVVDAELVLAVDELLKSELAGQSPPAVLTRANAEPGASMAELPAALPKTSPAGPDFAPAASAGSMGASIAPGRAERGPMPGGTDHALHGFTIDDFPVLHMLAAESRLTASPASGAVRLPQQSEPGATPGSSVVPLDARPAALASLPAKGAPAGVARRRMLLPGLVVALVLAGGALLWWTVQVLDSSVDVRGSTGQIAGLDTGPNAEAPRAGIRSGVIALPPVAANQATAAPSRPAPPSDTAPNGVRPLEVSPGALSSRLPGAPSAGDDARQTGPAPAVEAGASRATSASKAPLTRDAAQSAPGQAARLAISPAAAVPSVSVAQRPAQDAPQVTANAPAPVAACTAAALTMGLCAPSPDLAGVREPAAKAADVTPSPACEPSRSALGLCAER